MRAREDEGMWEERGLKKKRGMVDDMREEKKRLKARKKRRGRESYEMRGVEKRKGEMRGGRGG